MIERPQQLVGRVVGGRYRLETAIGVGGMGAVFRATQLDLGRTVAVKVLLDADERSTARLRQEALTAGSLSCPYIVSIFDFQAPPDEPPFVVMELLAGESLAQLLARERVLPVDRACRIATEALIGLDFAHRAGVTHRDVKPSNLWLSAGRGMEGQVKVLDFGIAKQLGGDGGVDTTTGALLGTPAYVSPEQLRGSQADERSDQHAIGVVLFEMLAGSRPWQAQGVALYAEILERVPPLVDQLAPQVPHELARVIARALAKDPGERFASADALRVALLPFTREDTAAAPQSTAGAPPGKPSAAPLATQGVGSPPRGRRHMWILAVCVLVPGGLVGAYLLGHRTSAVGAAAANAPDAAPPIVEVAAAPSSPPAAVPGPTPPASVPSAPASKPSAAPLAATARTKPRCECIDVRGLTLCQRPMTPRCGCFAEDGASLCPVKRDPGTNNCPVGTSENRRGPDLVHGAACSGFLDDGQSTPGTGKLDCNVCYGHPKEPATPGAPCQGIRQAASTPAQTTTGGLWACEP